MAEATEIEKGQVMYWEAVSNGLTGSLGIRGEGREKRGLLLQDLETEQKREGP